jgi:hypothetical protein
MKWRNPKNELPKDGQKVWALLAPRKNRGSLMDSMMSMQIVCGETSHASDGSSCRVDNGDELGQGNISWYLTGRPDYAEETVLAWLPVEEMFCDKINVNLLIESFGLLE